MNEPDVSPYLLKENLFGLFREQLKKDFEGSGLDAGFTERLPQEFGLLKNELLNALEPVFKGQSSQLPGLLYRIDISESQLKNYSETNPALTFYEVVAELIIKRILQKVILKKTFSK